MRACSSASGGVMFIPDAIERKQPKVSYSELVQDEAPQDNAAKKPRGKVLGLFGKRHAKQDGSMDKAA